MYNMWHPQLFMLLHLFQDKINPLDIMEYEEIVECVKQAIHQTVDEFAWELMAIHSISLAEARSIVVSQVLRNR